MYKKVIVHNRLYILPEIPTDMKLYLVKLVMKQTHIQNYNCMQKFVVFSEIWNYNFMTNFE